MSLVPDPETSYTTGYKDGIKNPDNGPSAENHKYQTAYMAGYRAGRVKWHSNNLKEKERSSVKRTQKND